MAWTGQGKLSNCLPDEISLYVMTLSQLFSHSVLSLSHYQQCISKHSDQKVNTTKRKQFNTPPCYQQVAKSLEQCPEILLSSCHLSPYLHLLELHLDWKKCHFQKIHLMSSWMIALCFLLSCFPASITLYLYKGAWPNSPLTRSWVSPSCWSHHG